MLKKSITYENFNGETVTKDCYFNLTKAECVLLQFNTGNGYFEEAMKQVINERDAKKIGEFFKEIILTSYGEKSADGERFEKSEEIRKRFESSAAFSELFMEITFDDVKAAEFLKGILPVQPADHLKPAN